MPDRSTPASPLAATTFAAWRETPLAGDASARTYARLSGPDGETAILMRAPPDSLPQFLAIARHLAGIGLCPPHVLHEDPGAGLLVLEDLGPRHVAAWLVEHPDKAPDLYAAAVDVLAALQDRDPPEGLAVLDPETGGRMLAPLTEWYAPDAGPVFADDLARVVVELLATHAGPPDRLALRDYHAENLIWRPERHGTDRIGLLDFQDALLAPAAYDLASLLRDARRDTDDALRAAMIRRFATATGGDLGAVTAAVAVLGLQRNLRILGIFARLARQDGKTRYLDFLPRLWMHVRGDLGHPVAAPLRPLIDRLPPPDDGHMARLRAA